MHDPIEPLIDARPDSFLTEASRQLEEARAALDRFKAAPGDASFESVLTAFDAIVEPLNGVAGMAHLFFQVHPSAEMRAAGAEVEQELQRFSTELSLDRDVYARLAALKADDAPDDVAARVVEHALRDYRRAGVDKDEEVRARLRELREELVEIGQQFARNIASDVRTVTIPEGVAGLDGLPEDFIAAHPPDDHGAVTITTDPTDFLPFMKYASAQKHREALWREWNLRAVPDNLGVLDRLLRARHELATLLGYDTWAAYITEDKMIETAENVAGFIDRVTDLARNRAAAEMDELRAFAGGEVRDFDRTFLMERLREQRFGFDARDMRPYFPYASVRDGVMAVSAKLYGLEFVRLDVPVWHPDVEAWEIVEAGRPVARFYLDMHPREDKYKHGAMMDVVTGLADRCLPQACLVCNFPRPDDDDPALMEMRNVLTYFHEFGHLLHHLLGGRQRWLSVSGITTEWDFVEVPSQLFEEWARDADIVATFARHHETGEPIPRQMVDTARRAEDYGKGLNLLVQMFYASLSLEYYSRDPNGIDTTEVMKDCKARHLPFPHEDGTFMQASFGHLDGYSAIYYTYMWSLVLAKDIFSRFKGDLMNGDVARDYRRAILEPGGSKDAADLVADFLGRPFGFEAFESWLAADEACASST